MATSPVRGSYVVYNLPAAVLTIQGASKKVPLVRRPQVGEGEQVLLYALPQCLPDVLDLFGSKEVLLRVCKQVRQQLLGKL